MTLYRIAYEYPKTGKIGRCTFVAPSGVAAQIFAGRFCHCIRAYWLSLVELRQAEVNQELELT